jgi:hypothetical protein
MNWRQWIGLTPTEANLAHDLILAAKNAGDTDWRYDAAESSLRGGERVINLANIHREYAQAAYLSRPALLKKYRAMIATSEQLKVAQLWTLAQTRIYPILRSRYEHVPLEIQHRQKQDPFPPRAAKPFLSQLDIVIGYDHGQTVSQVKAATVAEWGVPMDTVTDYARANLRALPTATWEPAGNSVWKLESQGGYNESFLQLPKTFDQLPAKGTPLAMIPNRGVLLATGADEPNGLAALLDAARQSIQEAPWPLCGDLFRITAAGPEPYLPASPEAELLATIKKIDIAGIYDAQKSALQAHHDAINDVVYVASYGLLGTKDNPSQLQSWCSWTQGVPSLLPATDLVALVWDSNSARKTALLRRADVERLVGQHFKPTAEDPPRTRVDSFPTPDELIELTKLTV